VSHDADIAVPLQRIFASHVVFLEFGVSAGARPIWVSM